MPSEDVYCRSTSHHKPPQATLEFPDLGSTDARGTEISSFSLTKPGRSLYPPRSGPFRPTAEFDYDAYYFIVMWLRRSGSCLNSAAICKVVKIIVTDHPILRPGKNGKDHFQTFLSLFNIFCPKHTFLSSYNGGTNTRNRYSTVTDLARFLG